MKAVNFRIILASSMLVLFGLVMMSYVAPQKAWEVPAKFKTMKNPVKADATSQAAGKELWNKNCASCHGKAGLGDGVKARTLESNPGNFSKDLNSQADGDLFYKTKTGRGEMPKYEGKLADDEVWNVINYMRTFKK